MHGAFKHTLTVCEAVIKVPYVPCQPAVTPASSLAAHCRLWWRMKADEIEGRKEQLRQMSCKSGGDTDAEERRARGANWRTMHAC